MTHRVVARVPLPGELAVITGDANVVYGRSHLTFEVRSVQPSTLDQQRGRDVESAVWLHLTGWAVRSLRLHAERGRYQTIPVLRSGIRTIVDVPQTRHVVVPDVVSNRGVGNVR